VCVRVCVCVCVTPNCPVVAGEGGPHRGVAAGSSGSSCFQRPPLPQL